MENSDVEKSEEETNRQIDSNTKSNSKQQVGINFEAAFFLGIFPSPTLLKGFITYHLVHLWQFQSVEKANEHPEWLPDGWNVEVRTRKSGAHMGSGYKCYIDPLKGYKFFSKPEVLRYLETVKDNSSTSKKGKKCSNMHSPNNSCTSKKEKKCSNMHSPNDNSCTSKKENKCSNMDSPNDNSCTSAKEKKCSNMDSPTDVVVMKSTVEDLPPGWIKELKIRKNSNGIRKDPFYIDPVGGYVFRSKKDVLRYLESGDIHSCAFKPSRREIQDEDNLTPPPAAKRQKLKQSAPKQQLSAAIEIVDKSSLELPDANSSRKGKNANVPSGMMVTSVPMVESVVKMRSLEDGASNSSEMKKTTLLKNKSLKESEKALSADDVQEREHAVNMMENDNEKKHCNHSISKNKKEFNVGHRSSPRLAGRPVQLVNNVTNEQTLQVAKRNLRKSRHTLDVDIPEDQAVSKEQPHQQETDRIEDSKPEIQISSNKSSNKKDHCLPRRASKRLAGIEHISCEEAPKYKSKKSKDEVKVKLQQSEGGPVMVLADHAPINGKSANRRKKSEPWLEKYENEEMNDEKSEPQLSFAFHYSWSDPSLENAINTLTGVLQPDVNRPTTVPETDVQKISVDNVTGKSTTTVPETDIQKTSVDIVTGRCTTTVPGTDIQKTLVDIVTGRSAITVPETDIQETSVDNGPGRSVTTVPETDIQKTSVDNVLGRSATTVPETDLQRTLVDNVPGRSATTVPETDIQKTSVDNVPGRSATAVPETDIQKTLIDNVTGRSMDSENNLLDAVKGSRERNSQVRSNKPKRKKESKVPMRLSKRLAGLEPEVLPAERALEYSSRKSCKEPTATATLANGVSDHHDAGEETKLTLQASGTLKTEVVGESSNQSEKSYDAQTGQKEQLQKVEAENIGDQRSELQLPLPFGDSWSDPCLEFAIKTLTGALPVDAGADIMPLLPPGFDNPPYKELHGSVVTSINQEARDNSNPSQNKKELNMASQPELRTSSTSYENAPKFTTRESYVDQGNIIRNSDGEPRHTGNIAQPVHHSRNINTLTHEEPLKENGQLVGGDFFTTERQLLETGIVNHDNSELQYCTQFMNSWSDPCLEFAFKTLTGVIPVEENLTLQGCFQEPANYHERRDGGSMLPDIGTSSFSQSDFSFLHDTGVKSIPGGQQQSSMNSPFLPSEKTTLQGCAGVDSQTHFSKCTNNFQRRNWDHYFMLCYKERAVPTPNFPGRHQQNVGVSYIT
ncbi:Methyl-CpG-binding domain-containing protein 13, partial [Mucuna pruriens]